MRHKAHIEIAKWWPGTIPRDVLPELDEKAPETVANWSFRSGDFISNNVYFQPESGKPELLNVFRKAPDFFSDESEDAELEYFEPGDEIEVFNSSYAFLEFNEEQPYDDEWEFSVYIFASFECTLDASSADEAEQIIRNLAASCFTISESEDPTPHKPDVVRVLEINGRTMDTSIWSDYCSKCGAGMLRAQAKFCAKCGAPRSS